MRIFALALLLASSLAFADFKPTKPVCIAPAKPGGGFDLTCRVVTNSLQKSKLIDQNMLVNFMPGGVGAIAYNHVISKIPKDANYVIAASVGSALNIAQGKFGSHDESAVRWIGSLGTDYGAMIVRADSKWANLGDMLNELKANPKAFAIGGGSSVGSQDWFKIALLVQAAGVDPKDIKYVPFEGGGEAITALLGGHIDLVSGDMSEYSNIASTGKYKALAALADERVSGELANVPTAKEQGYDVVWATWRGLYTGKGVSDEEYGYWVDTLKKLYDTEAFKEERASKGLWELNITGADFEKLVKDDVARFKTLAKEQGLIK